MMDMHGAEYEAGKTEMLPEWFFVCYRECGQDGALGDLVEVHGQFGKLYFDDAVSLSFERSKDVLTLQLETTRDVLVEQCSMGFLRQFGDDARILLNGYQSWTDTTELPHDARMPGLTHVSKRIVRRWVLDGGGDYAMAHYENKPGVLHGFTYLDVRNGEEHELLASLEEDDGFTIIYVDTSVDAVVVERECPQQAIRAQQSMTLCRLALVRGAKDQVYDRWFELSQVQARVAQPVVGYTSWYRHCGDISASKLLVDLQGVRFALDAVDCSGFVRLFQIDDGYCPVGDWTAVYEDRFPKGLASMASRIREAGFLPGIWVAPFVCERDSALFAQHPDWLLRDEEGNLVPTGSHWSGGYALDTLNPDVRDYVCSCLRTLTEEWGFGLVKADFLYAACVMPHGGMNRGQLMADAMDLMRQAVGENVMLLACGVPLGSAFGRVEYCRIGCDVGLDWDDAPHMRLLHRERVSTRNSLANTVFRAPLDGRAFTCDPDVFFLRGGIKLSADQKEQLLAADAMYGGMLLTSDDMSMWDSRSQALFQAAVDVLRQRKVGVSL